MSVGDVNHAFFTDEICRKNQDYNAKVGTILLSYTQSVPIRNGPIRHTSEIFGFFKKRLVKF